MLSICSDHHTTPHGVACNSNMCTVVTSDVHAITNGALQSMAVGAAGVVDFVVRSDSRIAKDPIICCSCGKCIRLTVSACNAVRSLHH